MSSWKAFPLELVLTLSASLHAAHLVLAGSMWHFSPVGSQASTSWAHPSVMQRGLLTCINVGSAGMHSQAETSHARQCTPIARRPSKKLMQVQCGGPAPNKKGVPLALLSLHTHLPAKIGSPTRFIHADSLIDRHHPVPYAGSSGCTSFGQFLSSFTQVSADIGLADLLYSGRIMQSALKLIITAEACQHGAWI